MAKFKSYYTLCPLIDQQNLLGVERDSNSGCALVTLGRNIVIRYKLQNLKQLSSWSSKERLITKVVYDEETKRYAAVFKGNYLRVWPEEETDLDSVKKHKFFFPIHTILTLEGVPPIVVLQNGACASLEWAIQSRKTRTGSNILKPEEKFVTCQLVRLHGKTYMCAMTKLDRSYYYIVVPLHNINYVEEGNPIRRIELKRTSEELVGHVVIQDENNANLLTLWSHGRLYSYSLIVPSTEPVPGVLISVITAVNTKQPVIMVALNETTIAMYGEDSNEEGAVLIIYNVKFKLVQAVKTLKLFTNDAKLWKIEDNLLLAANQCLAVVPFRVAPQQIGAVIGSSRSRKNSVEDEDVEVVRETTVSLWKNSMTTFSIASTKEVRQKIAKQVMKFEKEGMSRAHIHEVLIPQLIKSKDIVSIIWCLDNIKGLSEKLLVDLLSFFFKTLDKKPAQNGSTNPKDEEDNDIRNEFFNRILQVQYSEIPLQTYLKTGLSFNEILRLFSYLIERLDDENSADDDPYTDPNYELLCKWAGLLIDSHYQAYIQSRDSQVATLFNKLKKILDKHLESLKDLENLRPMLVSLISGKPLKPPRRNFTKFYSIEEIKLY